MKSKCNTFHLIIISIFLVTGSMIGCGDVGGLGTTTGQIGLTLTTDRARVAADGISSIAITATITNSSGTAPPIGTSLTFATTLGHFQNGSKTYTVTTADTTGRVIVSLISGTTTGTAKVTCTSGGLIQSINIDFFSSAPGTTGIITLSTNKTEIVGDGKDSAIITATLLDGYSKPVSIGTSAKFTTQHGHFGNGHKTLTETTSDSTGTVTATLYSVTLVAGGSDVLTAVSCVSNGILKHVYILMTAPEG